MKYIFILTLLVLSIDAIVRCPCFTEQRVSGLLQSGGTVYSLDCVDDENGVSLGITAGQGGMSFRFSSSTQAGSCGIQSVASTSVTDLSSEEVQKCSDIIQTYGDCSIY